MSDGYKPFIQPVSGRDEWIRTASYKDLRAALTWALEAEHEAADEYNAFAAALVDCLAASQGGSVEP